ncbi:hypothetical protein KR009_004562 [Drosophila setifemur]|nr:hypothetical protein KR009_004562 [Drosophila setifemur]
MDIELSLDEIIERKRGHGGRPADKKYTPGHGKPRKLLHKPAFKAGAGLQSDQGNPRAGQFDARNRIIRKTRAKIGDAREILNQNMRQSGIDARQLLLDRKKGRPPPPLLGPTVSVGGEPLPLSLSLSLPSRHGRESGVHMGRFGQRTITMGNRPGGGVIQAAWNSNSDSDEEAAVGYAGGGSGPSQRSLHRPHSYNSRLNPSAKPFVPPGYVDHDNMQDLEEEEISRTLHFGTYTGQPQLPPPRYNFGGFDMNRGGGGGGVDEDMDVSMSSAPLKSNMAGDPFAIYEASRNRIERPLLPAPLIGGRGDAGEKHFERRQRNMVATTNLPESLRARLFGGEPDRRVSHGIYANENNRQPSAGNGAGGDRSGQGVFSSRRSPPLNPGNHKAGYRLLVSNLATNVTTSDIRELFNDIGPMYDAHVVRPGTAEVIYKSLENAELAVDTYHHREFDGQPMHCVLVNPHSSSRSAHSASSRTVTTNSSGVEVDIDALHSVLFRDR